MGKGSGDLVSGGIIGVQGLGLRGTESVGGIIGGLGFKAQGTWGYLKSHEFCVWVLNMPELSDVSYIQEHSLRRHPFNRPTIYVPGLSKILHHANPKPQTQSPKP